MIKHYTPMISSSPILDDGVVTRGIKLDTIVRSSDIVLGNIGVGIRGTRENAIPHISDIVLGYGSIVRGINVNTGIS